MTRDWPDTCDLLVIGGGIVGASVCREAALRGLNVCLVEKNDLASGTSGASSRLIHGGLRYLAQGRIGLVRESSREKMVLSKIAPHLVEPLRFVFPAYRGGWPKWKLRLGVTVYDWLCGGANLGRSEALDRESLAATVPGLTGNHDGGVSYFDAFTNDARLVIDSLRGAEHAGARVATRTSFLGATRTGKAWQARLAMTDGERSLTAGTIVNATGPWSPEIPGSSLKLRLSRGVHVTVDRERLPLENALVMPEGQRILFVIPWGARIILGTTDTDHRGTADVPPCSRIEARSILEVVNRNFPEASLEIADIRSTWAGLRPLVDEGGGTLDPSSMSRRHTIRSQMENWWDVGGGKLTTCRHMGEEVVDRVCTQLDRGSESVSASTPLIERPDDSEGLLPPDPSHDLVARYCREEWAFHLDDVMIRRSRWHSYRSDRLEVAAQVVEWMAGVFKWTRPRCHEEYEAYRHLCLSEEGALSS